MLKSLKIGSLVLAHNVVLAPLAGITNLPFRLLCRQQGAFMTSPILTVASSEVKDEFRKFRDTMLQFMGQTLPQQVPTPEEAAAMGMQQPQPGQQQQMPPQGMMPNG